MATKIFGWGLLIIGVLIIGWTLYSSYNIFTGKTPVPEIFKVEKEIERSLRAPLSSPTLPPLEALEEEVRQMISEQLKGILPIDTLPKLLNLTVWSMLAFILIFGGSQISSLGIKLIKK